MSYNENQIDPNLEWGTYGKNGDQPLKFKKLRNCSTEHLKAILRTQKQATPQIKETVEYLLQKREEVSIRNIPLKELPLYINEKWMSDRSEALLNKRLQLGV